MQNFQIIWFRQDLRLNDNAALSHAASQGPILPIYILDEVNSPPWQLGGASKVWLHHSLEALNRDLAGNLQVYSGDALQILQSLVEQYDVAGICWGRCYEPWRIQRDTEIRKTLIGQGVEVSSFNNSLLWEPWQIKKNDGSPYKVFTPFYQKGCLNAQPPRQPLPAPAPIEFAAHSEATHLDNLSLLPEKINWHLPLLKHWEISEAGAQSQLEQFLETGLQGYKSGRDFPAEQQTSRLSPYLHFGQISPFQVWDIAHHSGALQQTENDLHKFSAELGWREFSHHLLYHNPELPSRPLQQKFDRFPWAVDKQHLRAWQQGQTGYPIVDAGMRELWQTGYMHNRVRMIVASFLVKNLLIPWQQGADWFWDCLFDADLANNSASWQWVAGCGADAAPYFRIFNPVTQGEKFDAEGQYVKTFVPELADLPTKFIHSPWQAPEPILTATHIRLGIDYPQPIVELKSSRERALNAYQQIR